MVITVHIHNRFTSAENATFRRELESAGINPVILCGGPDITYRNRIEHFLYWARLIATAWRKSGQSLASKPRPHAIMVSSPFEVMIAALRCFFMREPRPKIGLTTFIVTSHGGRIKAALRREWYRLVLSASDIAFCHTPQELVQYRHYYPQLAQRLHYLPFGLSIDTHNLETEEVSGLPSHSYIFAAGRSSRDYATLIEAVRGLSIPLYIACENVDVLPDQELPENVKVLRNCHGNRYFRYLENALLHIVPLKDVDCSAGQMAIVTGFRAGTAQITTDIPAIRDYTDHGRVCQLVLPGDTNALRTEISRLWEDAPARRKLAQEGSAFYETHLTRASYWRKMLEALLQPSQPARPNAAQHQLEPAE